MKVEDVEITQNTIRNIAGELGETVEQFTERAIEERVDRIVTAHVEKNMEMLCEELHKRGYDITETLPKFIDFTPVFAALEVDAVDRENNITRAIEMSIADR